MNGLIHHLNTTLLQEYQNKTKHRKSKPNHKQGTRKPTTKVTKLQHSTNQPPPNNQITQITKQINKQQTKYINTLTQRTPQKTNPKQYPQPQNNHHPKPTTKTKATTHNTPQAKKNQHTQNHQNLQYTKTTKPPNIRSSRIPTHQNPEVTKLHTQNRKPESLTHLFIQSPPKPKKPILYKRNKTRTPKNYTKLHLNSNKHAQTPGISSHTHSK